ALLSSSVLGVTKAISWVAPCKLPSALPYARRCPQRQRYCVPFKSMTTSAKHSAVCRVMTSLLLLLMLLIRGVSPYSARQIASKIVVLPAPVCPVMANMPSLINAESAKSICHSPFKEFKFLSRSSIRRMCRSLSFEWMVVIGLWNLCFDAALIAHLFSLNVIMVDIMEYLLIGAA